ncbi:MAG: hypothetical protein MJZ96_08930, partial [Paludibacteraceae bacterium]|nr:hypothetical protein [Paludibacteraceae bacterium]
RPRPSKTKAETFQDQGRDLPRPRPRPSKSKAVTLQDQGRDPPRPSGECLGASVGGVGARDCSDAPKKSEKAKSGVSELEFWQR